MSGKTLDEIQDEIGAWGDQTFPSSTVATVASHFEEEAGELVLAVRAAYAPPVLLMVDDAAAVEEEAADCFLLLLHVAHKAGFSLVEAAERKMAVNRRRTWKTTPEPGGHFKHAAPAPVASADAPRAADDGAPVAAWDGPGWDGSTGDIGELIANGEAK